MSKLGFLRETRVRPMEVMTIAPCPEAFLYPSWYRAHL